MGATVPWLLETSLLAGYIVFNMALNTVALFISLFYQRKINQPAPKTGFILSLVLALIFITLVFTNQKPSTPIHIIETVALLGSSIASIISVMQLFLTMKKVRK
jgi:ABC-type Fe3+-siderophore transport system permease subunit